MQQNNVFFIIKSLKFYYKKRYLDHLFLMENSKLTKINDFYFYIYFFFTLKHNWRVLFFLSSKYKKLRFYITRRFRKRKIFKNFLIQ